MEPTTEKDLLIRKEFAKAFNWYVQESAYGYSSRESRVKEPTWVEIFVELGKLLQKSDMDIPNAIRNTLKHIQNESLDLN